MQASSYQIMDSMSIEGSSLIAGRQHIEDPAGKEAGGGPDWQGPPWYGEDRHKLKRQGCQ